MIARKFALLCFLCCIAAMVPITVNAEGIQFSLTEGIDNAEVKSNIESNVSRLLTEINAAIFSCYGTSRMRRPRKFK